MNKSKMVSIASVALAVVAGGLLLASLRMPLWHIRMEAPQYHDEEALKVNVLPGSLNGDLREIKVLNRYIGVHIPDTLPQTHWLPIVIGAGAVLGLIAAFLPPRIRRFAAPGAAALLAVAMLTAAGQAQWQMYHLGHARDQHTPLQGIKDFTPPLLGNLKLANFELKSRLGPGSAAIAGAIALYAAIGFAARKKKLESRKSAQPIDTFHEEGSAHAGAII